MKPVFLLQRAEVRYKYILWLAPLVLLWSGAVSAVRADSGFLKALSITAAKGAGPLSVNFTVKELTLTSTTSTPTSANFDFNFGGELDFGDGVTPPETDFPLALVKQTKKGGKDGTVVWRDELQGVVSHTYPAAGTYTATLSHCCLADTYVSYGYVSVTDLGEPLEATVKVTVQEAAGCQEKTIFKQLDCQLNTLLATLDGVGLENRPTYKNTLKNLLNIAKTKRVEAEDKCALNDAARATSAVNTAAVKVHSFAQKVNKSPYIEDSMEAVLISQATPIEDLMNDLINVGVCSGSQCLSDPPLSALQCEIGNLLEEVALFVTDEKLAVFLTKKLDTIDLRRGQIITACENNKPKLTTGKIKSALGALKAIEAKVNWAEKKQMLPTLLITSSRQASSRMKVILEGLLVTGACQ